MKFTASAFTNLAVSALLACSAAGAPFYASVAAPETMSQVQVGKEAPDFTLTDIDGKKVNLSDFREKVCRARMVQRRLPIRQEALQQRQYAIAAKGIHQERSCLALDMLIRCRSARRSH